MSCENCRHKNLIVEHLDRLRCLVGKVFIEDNNIKLFSCPAYETADSPIKRDVTTISQDELHKKAKLIFEEWAKAAQNDFPDYSFELKDEEQVVIDLQETIIDAVKSAKKESTKENSYRVGLVWGYLQGALNKKWYSEYILKRSEQFKTTMALTALRDLLLENDYFRSEVEAKYRELLEENTNFTDSNYEIILKTYDSESRKMKHIYSNSENQPTVLYAAENERLKKVLEHSAINGGSDYFPDMEKYFSYSEILSYISE